MSNNARQQFLPSIYVHPFLPLKGGSSPLDLSWLCDLQEPVDKGRGASSRLSYPCGDLTASVFAPLALWPTVQGGPPSGEGGQPVQLQSPSAEDPYLWWKLCCYSSPSWDPRWIKLHESDWHHMEQKNRLAKLFLKCKMPCIAFSITLWAPHYTAEDNWDNRPRGYWWIWFGRIFPGTFPSSWETLLLLHLWMLPRLLVKKSEGKTKHQGPLSGRPCRASLPPEWGWTGGWRTWATQWMIWMTGSEPLSHFREW